jgi:UDP-glucose 4-epimerase
LPLVYYETNVEKTRSLLSSAIASGVRHFVFSSTAAVYGESSSGYLREDDAPAPINPYGRSKLITEWMLADASRAYGLTYACLRYFNVAGADPEGKAGQCTSNATHLIKIAVQTALGLRPHLSIFGPDYDTLYGTCVRDYIQVTDLCRAHAMTVEHLRSGQGNLTCNVGYGRGHSVLEVIKAVREVSGANFPVEKCGRRAGDLAVSMHPTKNSALS